jgi:DNA-binding transcriptional MerR regulator
VVLTIGQFARLGQVSPRMLRHYDDLGLLRPEKVEPSSGYRLYRVAQLARLQRLLALRDLGLNLEQIRDLLDDEPSIDQLRGMLRLRQAQIEQSVGDELARLRRVEARLRALEGSQHMSASDVVLKTTQPLRIAEASAVAPGFGPENLGPVLNRLYGKVIDQIVRSGARPGLCVAWYEESEDDGTVTAHAGFEIKDQTVTDNGEVHVVDLPVIQVASVVHRGSIENVTPAYETLLRWIEDSGYRLAGRSRELYHEWHDDDPSQNVTELQMPVAA